MAILGTGSLRENLLTNSGFDVWSDSTLANTGDQMFLAWNNSGAYAYSTMTVVTTSSNQIDFTALTNDSSLSYSWSNNILTPGKIYRIEVSAFNGTGNPQYWTTQNSAGNNEYTINMAVENGAIVFEAGSADVRLAIYGSAAASTNSFSMTMFEQTPGYTAASSTGPDTWSKSTNLDCFREQKGSNVKEGTFYGVNLGTVDGQYLQYPKYTSDAATVAKFAGRTVTFGCWMKSDNSSSGIILYNGDTQVPDTHTGGNTFEWLECTTTIATNVTEFKVNIRGYSTSANTYACQPILVFGSSIGEGNYTRPQGEVVWFQQVERSNLYPSGGTSSISSSTNHVVQFDSDGVIPKGVKAIYVSFKGECATVEKYLKMRSAVSPSVDENIIMHSQVANISNICTGWVPVDIDGLVRCSRNATWNNVELVYLGVEL